MFDTMTVTKAGGALCGAFLILLLGKWVAEGLYRTGAAGHGEEVAQAYTVETGSADGAAAEAEAGAEAGAAADAGAAAEVGATAEADSTAEAGAAGGSDFATVFASADAALGEKVFGKCKACHKLDGSNATGPYLNGVVGRAVASVEGFRYSDGMKAHGGDWTPEVLETFLANPKGVIAGTKMSFAGLPKVEDRANVIAYLASIGG